MMARLASLLLVLAAGLSTALHAQEPWRASYFPYPFGSPSDGAMLVFRYQYTQNAPYFIEKHGEDVINPITFRGALSAEAGIGSLGTRFARLDFRGPGIAKGWRFNGSLVAERRGRLGFYGFGGDLDAAAQLDDPNANAYRVHRSRYQLRGEVTRQVVGPLSAALALSLEHTRFTPLEGASDRFVSQFGSQPNDRTDFLVRPAMVFDTRDREFTPGKGVLFEAGFGAGTARTSWPGITDDKSLYALGYVHLREYLSLREGTVVAWRVLYRTMEDAAPLAARFRVPGWEGDFDLGGPKGHRSFPIGAVAGTSVEIASLDLRHDLLNAGDFGAVTLVGFVDWASISDNLGQPHDVNKLGGGGGIALRILRSAILSFNFAGGPNGFNFSMGNGWAF